MAWIFENVLNCSTDQMIYIVSHFIDNLNFIVCKHLMPRQGTFDDARFVSIETGVSLYDGAIERRD